MKTMTTKKKRSSSVIASRFSLLKSIKSRSGSVREESLNALMQLREIDDSSRDVYNKSCNVLKRYDDSIRGSLLHRVLDSRFSEEYTRDYVQIVLKRVPEQAKIRRRFDSALPIHLVLDLRHGHPVEVMKTVLRAYPDATNSHVNKNHSMVQDCMKGFVMRSSSTCRSRTDDILSDSFVSSAIFVLKIFPGCSTTLDTIGSLKSLWTMACYNCKESEWHSNLCKLTENIVRSRFVAQYGEEKIKDYQPLHAIISEGNDLFAISKLREHFFGKYLTKCAHVLDHNGRSLLVVALQSGYSWDPVVNNIHDNAPDLVSNADPLTGLYPFMFAAQPRVHVSGEEGYKQQLDTVYHVFRSNPFASKISLKYSTTSQWINHLTDENIALRDSVRIYKTLEEENKNLKTELEILKKKLHDLEGKILIT
mmetsp:Transcript_4144/g.5635  ORF Transcript_4144/g.5635 Transcript_4144/m.5635 type:complete len:421 (-) Transcript_4144:99-1361(-)